MSEERYTADEARAARREMHRNAPLPTFQNANNRVGTHTYTAGGYRGAAVLDRNKGRVLPPRPPMMTRIQRDAIEDLVKAPRQTRPGR